MGRAVAFAAALLGFLGCGVGSVSDGDPLEEIAADAAPSIVGDLDWTDTSRLPAGSPERRVAESVVFLRRQAPGRCTGFMVNDDVLMTNYHCVPGPSAVAGVVVAFGYELMVSSSTWDLRHCEEWVGGSSELDYALVRCADSPGRSHGHLTFAPAPVQAAAAIYLVHQNCDYFAFPSCDPSKKLSRGAVSARAGNALLHTADSLGGSSGGPLLDPTTHLVVGVHRAHSGFDARGRGGINWAVPAELIVSDIRARYPQVTLWVAPPPPESTEEVAPPPPPEPAPVEPPPGPAREREANNHASEANVLAAAPARLEGRVDAEDEDWFVLEHVGGALEVSLRFTHATGDLDLALFDAGLTPVGSSAGVGDVEVVSLSTTAGRYYVQVYGYGGAGGAYLLVTAH